MPYLTPSSTSTTSSPILTQHSLGRPGHRRSYSSSSNLASSPINFSNERGPGAFTSLGSLPRRTSTTSSGITINTTPKFHLNTSSGSSSSDSENDDDDNGHPPPLKLKKSASPSFGVPFPKSSPLSSPIPGDAGDRERGALLSPLSGIPSHITSSFGGSPRGGSPRISPSPSSTHLAPPSPRPSPSRTSSSPILLSNGKPLKSSLKSSSSTSNIPAHHPHHHHHHHPHQTATTSAAPTQNANHLHPTNYHLRAQSAPSTPWVEGSLAPSTSSSVCSSATNSPTTTPKNVHFPSLPTDLEHIRVFNKSAKPISFLRRSSDAARGPNGNIPGVVSPEVEGQETETETETDREGLSSSWGWAGYGGSSAWGGSTWGSSSNWSKGGGGGGAVRSWGNQPTGSGAGDRIGGNGSQGQGGGYPFPRVPSPPQKQEEGKETTTKLELDVQEGYSVPSSASAKEDAFVVLESMEMKVDSEEGGKEKLELTVLVRNVAFEKQVVFRFTMDEWGTVSEVGGRYLDSVYSLSSPFGGKKECQQARTLGDVLGVIGHGHREGGGLGAHSRSVSESVLDTPPPYDRFLVSISLNDYLNLENRVMWGVIRYTCPGRGEWWDNNGGKNFRVGWKRVPLAVKPTPSTAHVSNDDPKGAGRERKAGRSLSAPSFPGLSVTFTTAPSQPTKPDVVKVQAQGEALQHRLSGFSLRNYVSPEAVKKSLPAKATSVDLGKKDKEEGADSGIGLYWPWGSKVVAKVEETKKEERSSDSSSQPGEKSKGDDYFSPSAPSVTGPTTPSAPTSNTTAPTVPTSTSAASSLPSSRTSSMSSTTSDAPSLRLPALMADDLDRDGGIESSTSSESLDSLMFGGSPPSSTFHRPHTRFVYGSPGDGDHVGIHDMDVGYRPGSFGGDHALNLDKLSSALEGEKNGERKEMKEIESPLSPPSPPSPPSPGSVGSGSETEKPVSSPEPATSPLTPSSKTTSTTTTNSKPSRPQVTTTGIPLGGGANGGDSDSLYKAFVKQWCFVESPRGGTPVTSPGGTTAGALGKMSPEGQLKA